MRSVLTTIALLCGMVIASPADAAPPDAASFAADCNLDGQVDIEGRQRFVGGSGVLTRSCLVVLGDAAAVIFRDVDLSGTQLVVSASHDDTSVRVIDSTFEFSGVVELTAGCCAGDASVPENNGSVIVRRSKVRAEQILLLVSFDAVGGRALVRESLLETTSAAGGISIEASHLAGSDGLVRVVDSDVLTAGPITLATGDSGRTVVRRSALITGDVTTVTTGATGTCVATGNTPAISCS